MEVETYGVNSGATESWEQQLARREEQSAALHKAEQLVLKETNQAIVAYREALNNAASSGDALAMTSLLSGILEGNINRLMALEIQQYTGEQIANTEDSIQGRILLQSLHDNTQLFYSAQEQLITAITDKNTITNDKNALVAELENTKQSALYTQSELESKTNEYKLASVNLVNQITQLHNQLTDVIETSSALQPTQQQLALVSSEKEILRTEHTDLLQAYNAMQNTTKQKDEYYANTLEQLKAEKNNLVETRERELVLFEKFKNDAIQRIAVAEGKAIKMASNEKQLVLSQVSAIDEDRKEYLVELNRVQEEAREKQSKLTIVETKFEFSKNSEAQLKSERDQLSRLLERAKQEKVTQEANLRAAQQKAQEESLRSQSLYNRVNELEAASVLAFTVAENESANQQLVLQIEEIDNLRNQLVTFQSQMTRAQQDIGEAERKQKANLDKIDSLEKINKTVSQSLEETNKRNEKQRDNEDRERSRLLTSITSITQQLDDTKAAMRQQSQIVAIAQNDEAETLRKELENVTKKNRDDLIKISTLTRTIEEKERAIILSNSNLDQEALENELLRIQTALKNEETIVAQLEIKLTGAQTRLSDHEVIDKQSQTLHDARQKELVETQKRFLDATKDAQKLESEKLELVLKLNATNNTVDKISLYEFKEGQFNPLPSKFVITDPENSELIRSNATMRHAIEEAIRYLPILAKMQVFVGGTTGFREMIKVDLYALANYVLMRRSKAERLIKESLKGDSNGGTTVITTKRKPVFALGASALHSLNQFEMIAQTEWLSLNRQLTEPGEYSVEVAFSRDMPDFTEHEEFHFLMRDVRLLANPNDTAGGERFFVIDLTSPGDRVIYGLGSMGVADVIYGKGSMDIIVREKKSNTVVKQETLAYEFVPQKNLQYNTKVSAGINDSVSMHARYLGTSYIIEDILIRQ